jgi:hypothetical protein
LENGESSYATAQCPERPARYKRLNSDSYKAAISNVCETATANNTAAAAAAAFNINDFCPTPSSISNMLMMKHDNNHLTCNGSSSASSSSAATNSSSLAQSSSEHIQQHQNSLNQAHLIYKRQEANYYVQQILTNLLAIGVLEYESGFENAINKTFKVNLIRNSIILYSIH